MYLTLICIMGIAGDQIHQFFLQQLLAEMLCAKTGLSEDTLTVDLYACSGFSDSADSILILQRPVALNMCQHRNHLCLLRHQNGLKNHGILCLISKFQ